jgi:Domain of unknown function (DUF6430)
VGYRPFQLVFGTRRGWQLLAFNTFAAFGLCSAGIQLYSAVWVPKQSLPHPGRLVLIVGAVAILYGLGRAWPRRRVQKDFGRPDMAVTVKVGDLLAENTHLVIGFNDTFDTDITDNIVINSASVQGQFLRRLYANDCGRLDHDLTAALSSTLPIATESRADKGRGKLRRYPMGTVAVLGGPRQRFFCVAYSKMQNNLIAKSSVDYLWHSLACLWDAVYLQGQRGSVAMPIVGSDLARISFLDRESLLRMVLLSYVARSREELVCKELIVVIHPSDYSRINMLEVDAFLRTL